jgi:hypothetical protein
MSSPPKRGRPQIPRTPEYLAELEERAKYNAVKQTLKRLKLPIPDGSTTVEMLQNKDREIQRLQGEVAMLKENLIKLALAK